MSEPVIEAVRAGDVVTLTGLPEPRAFRIEHVDGPCWILRPEHGAGPGAGAQHVAHVARGKSVTWVHVDGRTHAIERVAKGGRARAEGDGSLVAPMTGKVVEVAVGEGATVEKGALVVAISAMKMRVELKAPFAGVIARLGAREGEQVEGGTLLALVEKAT